MIRSACLPAVLAAALGCAVATVATTVMAQGSSTPGATSTSPGSPPLAGDSFPPGSGVPSVPVPMNSGTGSGSGAGGTLGSGSTGTGSSTGSGASTTPPGGGVTPGNVPGHVDQAELARCNSMLSAARDQCLSDLRARSVGGAGARSGGAAGPGIYPPPNRPGNPGTWIEVPGAPATRLP